MFFFWILWYIGYSHLLFVQGFDLEIALVFAPLQKINVSWFWEFGIKMFLSLRFFLPLRLISRGEVGSEFRCQLTEPYQIGYQTTEVQPRLRPYSVVVKGKEGKILCQNEHILENNFIFPLQFTLLHLY